jgi:hypothetical protein
MKWCIVTTGADKSLNYFLQDTSQSHVETVLFGERLPSRIENQAFDIVYFRDPFNQKGYSLDEIGSTVAAVSRLYPAAYYVDGAKKLSSMMFEDKWRQYQLLGDFMPTTRLVKSGELIGSNDILKKRISSRGRGNNHGPYTDESNANDYIAQHSYEIIEEYRVFLIGGTALPNVAVRSSKNSAAARVRTIRLVPMNEELRMYVDHITKRLDAYDFLGVDVAETTEGYKLLEVNRAPQFSRYCELNGTNIALEVIKTVTERAAQRK